MLDTYAFSGLQRLQTLFVHLSMVLHHLDGLHQVACQQQTDSVQCLSTAVADLTVCCAAPISVIVALLFRQIATRKYHYEIGVDVVCQHAVAAAGVRYRRYTLLIESFRRLKLVVWLIALQGAERKPNRPNWWGRYATIFAVRHTNLVGATVFILGASLFYVVLHRIMDGNPSQCFAGLDNSFTKTIFCDCAPGCVCLTS